MLKNNYPSNFTDRCIKLFFNRLFLAKKIAVINFGIPFMGINSLKIRGKLIGLVKTCFPFCKIQVMFNSGNRLASFNDKVPLNARSLILHKLLCSSCNSAFIGKTKRHFVVRMFEHLGISLTTGINYRFNPKNNNNTAVLNHINCNNCDDTFR